MIVNATSTLAFLARQEGALATATSTDMNYLGELSTFGYLPSAAWALAFIIIFALIGSLHIIQAVMGRYWIVFPTLVLGTLGKLFSSY
jgi:hypothetical protein